MLIYAVSASQVAQQSDRCCSLAHVSALLITLLAISRCCISQGVLMVTYAMQIIETKVKKLEQLVRLKDAKIQTLVAKMQAAGLA